MTEERKAVRDISVLLTKFWMGWALVLVCLAAQLYLPSTIILINGPT